jgi:hypothetical protein
VKYRIRDIEDKARLIEKIQSMNIDSFGFTVDIHVGKRTERQQAALEVFCRKLAKELNDNNHDMRSLLRSNVNIPWTQASVKEHLWKPIQFAATGKKSTTKMDRTQVSEVYDILMKALGEKHGIFVAFPEKE